MSNDINREDLHARSKTELVDMILSLRQAAVATQRSMLESFTAQAETLAKQQAELTAEIIGQRTIAWGELRTGRGTLLKSGPGVPTADGFRFGGKEIPIAISVGATLTVTYPFEDEDMRSIALGM